MGSFVSHFAALIPSFFSAYLLPFLYTSKSEPVEFLSRRRNAEDEIDGDAPARKVNMEEFVKSKCPSLLKPYAPTWYLPKCVNHVGLAYLI